MASLHKYFERWVFVCANFRCFSEMREREREIKAFCFFFLCLLCNRKHFPIIESHCFYLLSFSMKSSHLSYENEKKKNANSSHFTQIYTYRYRYSWKFLIIIIIITICIPILSFIPHLRACNCIRSIFFFKFTITLIQCIMHLTFFSSKKEKVKRE